jgi:hypothetical protein
MTIDFFQKSAFISDIMMLYDEFNWNRKMRDPPFLVLLCSLHSFIRIHASISTIEHLVKKTSMRIASFSHDSFLLIVLCAVFCCFSAQGCGFKTISDIHPHDIHFDSLRCEYMSNPIGIDSRNPRLSWVIYSTGRGVSQSGYQILAASNEEILHKNIGNLWDSGKVSSDQSVHVKYEGARLSSYQVCFWKVRIWDQSGRVSNWSPHAYWSMGIIEPNTWKAKWIQQQNPTSANADKNELIKSIFRCRFSEKIFKLNPV